MQGVQTFFTTNHEGDRPANSSIYWESWGFYPDAKPIRSFYEGDARAAIAPFQAFKCALLASCTFPTCTPLFIQPYRAGLSCKRPVKVGLWCDCHGILSGLMKMFQ